MTSTTLETKAAALEGLDFIETEEDVKAVEAATLKIQSTFRGKKIRSKITAPKQQQPEQPSGEASSTTTTTSTNTATATTTTAKPQKQTPIEEARSNNENELSRKVAEMQVQDNTNNTNQMDQKQAANTPSGSLPEEEAERAATKIQAGFKGYKTRKELEGKLPATGSSGGQQAASAADD